MQQFRRDTLESRRREHERYLRRRLGRTRCWLDVEGRQAILDLYGVITVRFPAARLFRDDALSRMGI